MSYFSRFYKREAMINKKLEIDEELYSELERLSDCVYDASISKLVNAAIENLLESKDVKIYKRRDTVKVSRSFLIRESLLTGLYELKKEYTISLNLLVNIAIRNALVEEENEKKNQKELII